VDDLRYELAKYDNGVALLKRQRDEARRELKKWEELTANIELPDYPFVQFQPKDKDRLIDRLTHERDEARDFLTSSENLNADLRAMNDALADDNDRLEAERDKLKSYVEDATDDYAKLVKERDALRAENMALKADSDEGVPRAIKKRDEAIKILKTERDALATDLRDCGQQRERLRQALGTAIDHAHEIMALVDIDKEVAR